jgi:hypothetical protein
MRSVSDSAVAVDEKAKDKTDKDETGSERRKRDLRRFLVPGLIAGLVLALCLAVTFFVLWLQTADPQSDDVRDLLAAEKPDVEQRAIEVTNLLLTYDSTNLDEVTEKMLAISTGNFKQQYEELIQVQGLGAALDQAKASSRGQILTGPDVSFTGPAEATAILNVTQTTQNKENPTGQTVKYVIRITLVETSDGGWKADSVDLLEAG